MFVHRPSVTQGLQERYLTLVQAEIDYYSGVEGFGSSRRDISWSLVYAYKTFLYNGILHA